MKPDPEIRKLRKHLKALVLACKKSLFALDAEMERPASQERGQRIAAICNFLNVKNDIARHFGLGEKLRATRKVKAP